MGIKTITTDRTTEEGFTFYKILLASAYLSTIVLMAVGLLSIFSVIVFITAIEVRNIVKQFSEKIPLNSDQITSQLTLHFGLLLVSGELFNLLLRTFL
jgi:1,4-dihydroxy-2-naphthoate octaprenyltransferase